MLRALPAFALVALGAAEGGCNMVAGAGRDITNMSSAVQGWMNPEEGERINSEGGQETIPASGSGGTSSGASSSSRRASYQPNL